MAWYSARDIPAALARRNMLLTLVETCWRMAISEADWHSAEYSSLEIASDRFEDEAEAGLGWLSGSSDSSAGCLPRSGAAAD